MYQQPPPYGWQPPVVMNGPAPGVSYGNRFGRLIAYVIDYFVLGIVLAVPSLIVIFVMMSSVWSDPGTKPSAEMSSLSGVLLLVIMIVAFLWKPWFWSRGGQTPGYKMLGLRLVRAADGGPVTFGQGIGRIFGYLISGVVLALGFIWILFDNKHQGWHDKLAGTVVISA
jgi:uncharacterized RDD family membrane protein YckC